ncbi:MAG TPA: hypothetical protein VLK36_11570 [Gaiellaceae bacterium]|nr:hypothetical protein [Gaiellaceae bacterium]
MRLLAALLLGLIAVPSAGAAWVTVSTVPVSNTMRPGVLRTASGVELAAYSDGKGTLKVWSSATGDHTVAAGLLSVGKPALVQLPSGSIELYAPATTAGFALQGVLRFESTSDGASWSAPVATHSTSLADVESAAVRPDGTPMFSQDGTFGVVVSQGLNGEASHTVFGACCGYAESLAVDTTNYAQVAFWSNANAFPSQFVYEGLDATGGQAGPGRAFGLPQTAPHDDGVPLVADGLGNTFMGWAGGYPTATSFALNTFRGGNLVYSAVVGGGVFAGGDPHMALAVDPANRLWAVWTQNGAVHARRSRSAGRHFGAATVAGLGGATAYQVAAVALPAGGVAVYVDNGTSIVRSTLLPSLTVAATAKTITVADEGVGVKATLKGGGHTVKTSAAGKASLAAFRKGTLVTVTAAGYSPASFRKR